MCACLAPDFDFCSATGDACIAHGGRDVRGCALAAVTGGLCPYCLADGETQLLYIFEDGRLICSGCRETWRDHDELCTAYAGCIVELRDDREAVAAQRDAARERLRN